MQKKLYFHVGQYKTGSTSLQMFLANNRERLSRAGVLYPAALARDGGHFILDDRLRAEFRFQGRHADLGELLDEVSSREHGTLILSCEAFSGDLDQFNIEQTMHGWKRIAEIFGSYRICPVVYIRRQDEAIESRIVEAIKGRLRWRDVEVEKFLVMDGPLNYEFFLDRLAEVFGKEELIVRMYGRDSLVGGDVVKDFLQCIELDELDLSFDAELHNRAPSGKYLEFARRLNSFALDEGVKVSLRRFAWRVFDSTGESETAQVLGQADRRRIMAYFFESNVAVIKKYGAESLESFLEEIFRDSKSTSPNCMLDDVDVLDVLIPYISNQSGTHSEGDS